MKQQNHIDKFFAQIPFMLVVLLSMGLSALSAACGAHISDTGSLEGHVTIGPLAPALREGEQEPTPSPEMYAQRQIVILSSRGSREFKRVQIDPNGNYAVTLPAGVYTVDINHIGIDTADGLPTEVEILPDATIQLDISIDTGIR
jgi:hypothetical protein